MRPQPFVCVWLPEHLGWALGLNRTLVVQSCCKMSTIVTVCSEALLIIYSNIVRKGKWIFVMTLYNICNICILNHHIFYKDWISSFVHILTVVLSYTNFLIWVKLDKQYQWTLFYMKQNHSFPLLWFIGGLLAIVTQRMPLLEQQLPSFSKHTSSARVFCGVVLLNL